MPDADDGFATRRAADPGHDGEPDKRLGIFSPATNRRMVAVKGTVEALRYNNFPSNLSTAEANYSHVGAPAPSQWGR